MTTTNPAVRFGVGLLAGLLAALLIASPVQARPPDNVCNRPSPPKSCAQPTAAPTPTASPTVAPSPTPTVAPTPTPTATAAPTPTADPARPFPAPVTTATYTVPLSIDRTGATDVFTALNNWIATVPNGSVIAFPAGGIYRLSQGVMLGSRQHLVFQLGTSEFRLVGSGSSHFSSAFIPGYSYQTRTFTGGAAHLAFVGGIVRGNDPTPGIFDGGGENQQAVRCNGSQFIEVTGMEVHAVYGDGGFWDNCDDVWVHHTHVVTAGRNGLTVIRGQRVLGEDNAFDTVGYATFDLEPNFATEASADITFRRNTAGTWQSGIGFVSVDGAAKGADIRRVTISDNSITGMSIQIYVRHNGPTTPRVHDFVIINNRAPAGGVVRLEHIDGLTVYGNTGTLTLVDCVNVVTG